MNAKVIRYVGQCVIFAECVMAGVTADLIATKATAGIRDACKEVITNPERTILDKAVAEAAIPITVMGSSVIGVATAGLTARGLFDVMRNGIILVTEGIKIFK